MRQIRRVFRIVLALVLFSFLHYVLPQHDIAKITSTEVIRADFSSWNRIFYSQPDSGSEVLPNRDLRLINAQKKNTWLLGFVPRDSLEVMVYRNEDTGWIWPPYFKFDTADVQAEAAANISPPGEDRWVVITHYGWRNKYLSIYPNVVGIRPASGPDEVVMPWFNIFFFICLIVGLLMLRAMWRQFIERTVDPAMDAIGDEYDQRSSGLKKWWDSWRG